MTIIFAIMWLVSSCCWAKTLSEIKMATNPTEVLLLMSACRAPENKCTTTQEPRWSRLNTSVVGFSINALITDIPPDITNNCTHSSHPLLPPPGFRLCKRHALGRKYMVCLQRDRLVQDRSEVSNQECFWETFQ